MAIDPDVQVLLDQVNARIDALPCDKSVMDYGAVGDGVTDDTTAVQAAVDAGSVVYFPPGVYAMAGHVAVTNPTRIVAWPRTATISDLRPVDAPEQALFDVTAQFGISGVDFDGLSAPVGELTQRHVAVFVRPTVENVDIADCHFSNLTRKGAVAVAGDASLASEYALYLAGATNVKVRDCRMSEISGVGVFARDCENLRIKGNDVAMLSTGDCLYPIHLHDGNRRVFVNENTVVGGSRASGGAIDVMSAGAPQSDIHVVGNVIDGCNGFGSGRGAIRFLSVDGGQVRGNIVRNLTEPDQTYIAVRWRDLPAGNPSPRNIVVADNVLVCGGDSQIGIDIWDNNPTPTGRNVIVHDNLPVSDGIHNFELSLRARDIDNLIYHDNLI